MKIMLIEDDATKAANIKDHIISRGINESSILWVKNLTEVALSIHLDIGLFIIDLKLPSIYNGESTNSGKAILEMIESAGKSNANLLAISSYPSEFPQLRDLYESRGCILADYSDPPKWQAALNFSLVRLNIEVRKDFIIFCALREERTPYLGFLEGKKATRFGVEFYDVQIAGRNGTIALLPQMGLVSAAVTSSLCIDRLKPKLVCMSGICGGFEDRAALGQLVISTVAYEYQSGKWASDGFRQEPYQVKIDHLVDTMLKSMVDQDGFVDDLEKGFKGEHRPSLRSDVLPGIFTSGSAVIAQEKFMNQLSSGHRKVHALDMEVFSVQRAAELSPEKPACICVKTVVDLGQEQKDDKLHRYGAYVSAKFVVQAIAQFFLSFPEGSKVN